MCNEPQIKSTGDICCSFKNKLTFSLWPVVRLRLNAYCISHLKSGWIISIQKGSLIKFNHFSINVYLILWSSISVFCFGSNAILHGQTEWASVRKVRLEGQKPKLHPIVVLAPILVLRKQTLVLFACKFLFTNSICHLWRLYSQCFPRLEMVSFVRINEIFYPK